MESAERQEIINLIDDLTAYLETHARAFLTFLHAVVVHNNGVKRMNDSLVG